MACKTNSWYQVAAKWIGKTKNWDQVAIKCIRGKKKDWYQVAANWIGKVIQGLVQEQICSQIFSLGRFLDFQEAMQKCSQMTI